MTLKDTIPMMESSDYKERLAAECAQLLIRVNALMAVLADSDAGTLTSKLPCPRRIYDLQLRAMMDYITVLEARLAIEGVALPIDERYIDDVQRCAVAESVDA